MRECIAGDSAQSTRSSARPGRADVFCSASQALLPFGVDGGGPAALNRFFWQTSTGEDSPPLASKVTDVRIQRGQRIRLETPGGGGSGDPLARHPTLVARDLRLGYLYARSCARTVPWIADEKGHVDLAAITSLRAEHGLERGRQECGDRRWRRRRGTFTDVSWFDDPSDVSPSPRRLVSRRRGGRVHRGAEAPRPDSRTWAPSSMARRSARTRFSSARARIGVITTRGFRDVLECAGVIVLTPGAFGAIFTPSPTATCAEFDERVLADGALRTPVDLAKVKDAALALLEKGAEALVIIFITPTPTPPTSAPPRQRRDASGRTGTFGLIRDFAGDSRIQARRRPRSTPIFSPSSGRIWRN